MANTFINAMKQNTSFTHTTNGALAHSTTGSALYDLFARGGAMRQATEKDCIDLFDEAYKEDPIYARKCLFYLGDCRGGKLFA